MEREAVEKENKRADIIVMQYLVVGEDLSCQQSVQPAVPPAPPTYLIDTLASLPLRCASRAAARTRTETSCSLCWILYESL